MFGVMPHAITRLPLSEFLVMYRYYMRLRADAVDARDGNASFEPKDGTVVG